MLKKPIKPRFAYIQFGRCNFSNYNGENGKPLSNFYNGPDVLPMSAYDNTNYTRESISRDNQSPGDYQNSGQGQHWSANHWNNSSSSYNHVERNDHICVWLANFNNSVN